MNSDPDQTNSYTKRNYSHFKIYIHVTICSLVRLDRFSNQIQEPPIVIHK
jgi:hypothetical protein